MITNQTFQTFTSFRIAFAGMTIFYFCYFRRKIFSFRIVLKSLLLCFIFTPQTSAEISFSTKSLIATQKKTESTTNYLFNRIRAQSYSELTENCSIEIEYELFPSLIDSASDITTISIKNTKTRIYRITDLNRTLPGTPDSSSTSKQWQVEQNLDRAFVRLQSGNLEYLLGRQAVSFGGALISPTDVFAPVSFKALDQEFRAGVDAVRIIGAFGETTEIEGGIVAGKQLLPENSGAYLRTHFLEGKTDLTPMMAVFQNNQMLGLTLQTEMDKVGLVFDGAMVLQRDSAEESGDEGSKYWTPWTIGFNLNWNEKLFTMLEIHQNPMGTANPKRFLSNASSSIYKVFPVTLLGRDYLLPSLNYQISPLWSLSSSAFINLNDRSTLTTSGLEWNMSEDWLLSGSFVMATGKKTEMLIQKESEFGDSPDSFQLILKHYR